jgi:phosphatidylserine decarboxylase
MKSRALNEARWILGILAACCAVSVVLFPPAFIVFAGLLVFSLYFFRDPERRAPSDEALAVSPADGVVVEVKETGEEELIKDRVKRIAIFLSIFDVHVNRAPIAIRGKGMTVVVRQIAGAIARRICAWKQVGDLVQRGERFGMIRFGSRTEVDLPVESEILVKPGDRVRGGETAIARLSASQG